MKKFLNKKRKTTLALGILLAVILAQGFFIAKLYSEKDNKVYEVNLVKINTEKDSLDYYKLKHDLSSVDRVVRQLNSFLTSKNIQAASIAQLSKDSLNRSIYLAKQSNRYSQYLVDLEKKLQEVPLGMPADGYISSNFGNRKNPIPRKTTPPAPEKIKKAAAPEITYIEEKDSLGNTTRKAVAAIPSEADGPSKNPRREENNPPAEADQIQFHKGLDIAVAYGSDVRSAAKGTVIFAGQKGGYGNCVIISHGNGLATLYGHLSQILVRANDVVNSGTVIAKSGNTGRSTGPHLHYEVHRNNTPVNPKLFLNL